MASLSSPLYLIILFAYAVAISSSSLARSHEQNNGDEEMRSGGRRLLLGFKETPKGSNVTFECSPSGPCVSCNSSEKRKDKYRCSETGYRIPFKCREVRGGGGGGGETSSHKKDAEETQQNGQSNVSNDDEEVIDASVKQRNLRDDSSSPASKAKKSQSYKTYRSCVPSSDEERVSVLGFEAVMLGLLLVSGSFVYYRKKQTVPMAGGVSTGRSQSNSRF
ncbi:hypothetical protein BRARA_G02932 [Brassica rapa]|uniref:Transmembrane protein n=1 Tax=Brassica campestris TaxID=3711 RepID=A0A397YQJ8_BRACM|nr:hypothetical protein BRARA_G02932 [Brassica rapa]